MHKANRVIVWGSLLTLILVGSCLRLPFIALDPGDVAGEVFAAISLFAAYLILVLGVMAVGSGAYANLTMRRADAALETRQHRRCFKLGVAFCVLAFGFIFLSVVL